MSKSSKLPKRLRAALFKKYVRHCNSQQQVRRAFEKDLTDYFEFSNVIPKEPIKE